MIPSLDSSFDAPTLTQARAAKAAGIGFWWGYLATRPNVGLAAPWSELAFWNVLEAGLGCGAFVSGWDDPVALRELAQAWGIPLLALDDEDGIRLLSQPDWRPPFLQALGGGHYGLLARLTLPAQFRIAALYPPGGCTGATWPTPDPPPGPHGWQCQGTHTEFGLSVDRSALDDWFGGDMFTDDDRKLLYRTLSLLADGKQSFSDGAPVPDDWPEFTPTMLTRILTAVQQLQQPTVDPSALAAALATDQAFLDALVAALLHRAGGALSGA